MTITVIAILVFAHEDQLVGYMRAVGRRPVCVAEVGRRSELKRMVIQRFPSPRKSRSDGRYANRRAENLSQLAAIETARPFLYRSIEALVDEGGKARL